MERRSAERTIVMLHWIAVAMAGAGIVALFLVFRADGSPDSFLAHCLLVVSLFGLPAIAVLAIAYRMQSRADRAEPADESARDQPVPY
jgi:tellurite resistance protein TehA-like permease